MKSARWLVGCAGVLVLAGCPKSTPAPESDAGAARGDAGGMAVASLASDAATARGDAGGTAASSGAAAGAKFTVTYTVKPAAIYVPAHKDWASVKQKTDTEKLLGDGTLSLSVDAAGRVAGESTGGPLGTAILDGILDGAILSATVRRKDPKDEGLTGTLVATITADKLEGSMKLSEFNAAVVREATVTGKKN